MEADFGGAVVAGFEAGFAPMSNSSSAPPSSSAKTKRHTTYAATASAIANTRTST